MEIFRVCYFLVVFILSLLSWNISFVHGSSSKQFQQDLTENIRTIANKDIKDEKGSVSKTKEDIDLTPHRDLYGIFTVDHVTQTILQEAKSYTSDNGLPLPDTFITTDHMMIELKDVNCLSTTRTMFPDREKLTLPPPWKSQSDKIEVSLPCPRILKEPAKKTRGRRSAREELADIQTDITITLSNWFMHSENDDHIDDELSRRMRRSVNGSCNGGQCNIVNGSYGPWTPYSACSKTCGGGLKTRNRLCNNPAPKNGGNNCSGPSDESQPCNTNPCIECGGKLTGSGGNFSSPYFGVENYPSNTECVWNISVSSDYSIVVEFDSFHLEKDKKCYYDYLEFYDGPFVTSDVLERYCGQTDIYPVNSTDSIMVVKFNSDKDVQGAGFLARWYRVPKKKPDELDKYQPQRVTLVSSIYNPWRKTTKYPVPLGQAYSCPESVDESYQCHFGKAQMVISRIVSTVLDRKLQYGSSKYIKVTFQHILSSKLFPDAYNREKTCVYWNHKIPGTSSGAWSRQGSVFVFSNLTHTICKYYQPGSFAVLGDSEGPPKKLQLFANTYVGLSLAILGTIMTIVCLRFKLSTNPAEKMHAYQAFSISLLLFFYLLGSHLKADKHLCGFTAFCIYYFVLAAFFWLLLTVLHVHGKFSGLFSGHVRVEIIHFLIGWGIPLFLAGIAGGIEIDKDRQHDVCWAAARGGNVWSYAAPVFILVVIASALLVKLGLPTKDIVENYQYRQMRYRVAKTGLLLLMYVLSWVTGLLVIANEDFTSQYFFSMFLILMAVFLFVFSREETDQFKKENKIEEEKEDVKQKEEVEEEVKTPDMDIKKEDIREQQPKKRRKKKDGDGPLERVTVPTLKNLNIYKENGAFVIEA